MDMPFIMFAVGLGLLTVGIFLVMYCAPSDWDWAGQGIIGGIVLAIIGIVILILTSTGTFGTPPDLSGVYVPGAP